MKKDFKTYFLLFAVLGVWGTIGFRIYTHYNYSPKKEEAIKYQKYIHSANTNKVYDFKKVVRDPFTGKTLVKKPKKKPLKKVIKTIDVIFPNIVYKGFVNGKLRLFFVDINGNQYTMRESDIEQEVKLLSGSYDFIEVLYKGKRKKVVIKD